MEKITAYKRAGKFGDEYLIPLKCLELLRKKETEKAYCCGEIRNFYNSHFHTMKDEYNAKAEQYLAEKHLQEQAV